jgi:hypothetical protein
MPTSPNFYPAPVGVLLISELHSLIAIEINARFRIILFGKIETESALRTSNQRTHKGENQTF